MTFSLRLALNASMIAIAAQGFPAFASDLSYTFLDFESVDSSIETSGSQTPVPGQTVSINIHDGDGIAIGGSMAIGRRFYMNGYYKSSIIDVDGVIANPLTTVAVRDNFDLVLANIGLGYIHPIGESLDWLAEVSYDASNYDFGSFAGENFDLEDSGAAVRTGFRWNPAPPFELFVFGKYSPVAKPALSTRDYDSGTTIDVGARWYFFEDLGVALNYESGDVDTTTISMRFSFGNLPW